MDAAIVTIHPYRTPGWKGWVVAIADPDTPEMWHRPFYYKKDAERLRDDLGNMTLDDILDRYGTHYFEQVR